VIEAPSTVKTESFGVNILDCGVIVHGRLGALPAIQHHPAFGFKFAEPLGWVSERTARSMLPKECEIISLEEAT